MSKTQHGLGKGLSALLGGEEGIPVRRPVGYINKPIVSETPAPDTSDVLRIPASLIDPNPFQPRMSFAEET